jgi:hypothetical protein
MLGLPDPCRLFLRRYFYAPALLEWTHSPHYSGYRLYCLLACQHIYCVVKSAAMRFMHRLHRVLASLQQARLDASF